MHDARDKLTTPSQQTTVPQNVTMSLTNSPADSFPKTETGELLGHRLEYLIQEAQAFIHTTGYRSRMERASVEAVPVLSPLGNRADYHLDVRGTLTVRDWSEQLRDIVSRARSLLDNAMWEAAEGDDRTLYNGSERRAIMFPIAPHAGDWKAFERTPHGQHLPPRMRTALRAIQPFLTGAPTVAWLTTTNNHDKHRYPLRVATLPDRLFAIVFAPQVAAIPGEDAPGISWKPVLPVTDGAHVVTCSTPIPLSDLEVIEFPVALCVDVDGDWVDVQLFLQDIVEFTARATAILLGGSTAWADEHRLRFDAERAQVLDFQHALARNDLKAEDRWRRSGAGAEGYYPAN